jgi:hypothetical protein
VDRPVSDHSPVAADQSPDIATDQSLPVPPDIAADQSANVATGWTDQILDQSPPVADESRHRHRPVLLQSPDIAADRS